MSRFPKRRCAVTGLSLDRVASILREQNVELPGGQLKAEGHEMLLRAKNKGRVGEEIGRLPLVTRPGGVVLTVNDLGTVRDEFEDVTAVGEINGEPAMVVNVERTKSEDLLAMVDAVREYVDEKQKIAGWLSICRVGRQQYRSSRPIVAAVAKRDQGLMLVFLVLTLFLEMRLAFWVALGIPISILGAGAALAWAVRR